MKKRQRIRPDWFIRMAIAYAGGEAIALPHLLKLSKQSRSIFLTFPFMAGVTVPDPGIDALERAHKEGGLCAFGITLPPAAGEWRRVAFNGHVIKASPVVGVGVAFTFEYKIALVSSWFVY